MSKLCCVKCVDGKIVGRICTTHASGCRSGWHGFTVDSCEDCPVYPTGSKSEMTGSHSDTNVLADVSQRLAFAQGQLSVLMMTGTQAANTEAAEAQEPLDLNPLFDSLAFAIAQAPFCDEDVEKLTLSVEQARSGSGDLFQMPRDVCNAATSGLEAIGPGAYGKDDPLKALWVRGYVEVINAARVLLEMMKAPTDNLPEPKKHRKCKGKLHATCQEEPRWVCNEIKGGCISAGPVLPPKC